MEEVEDTCSGCEKCGKHCDPRSDSAALLCAAARASLSRPQSSGHLAAALVATSNVIRLQLWKVERGAVRDSLGWIRQDGKSDGQSGSGSTACLAERAILLQRQDLRVEAINQRCIEACGKPNTLRLRRWRLAVVVAAVQ